MSDQGTAPSSQAPTEGRKDGEYRKRPVKRPDGISTPPEARRSGGKRRQFFKHGGRCDGVIVGAESGVEGRIAREEIPRLSLDK